MDFLSLQDESHSMAQQLTLKLQQPGRLNTVSANSLTEMSSHSTGGQGCHSECKLTTRQQCTMQVKKANAFLGCSNRNITRRLREVICLPHSALVGPYAGVLRFRLAHMVYVQPREGIMRFQCCQHLHKSRL